MTYRIIFDLIDDPEVWQQRTSLRVYRELYKNPRIYFEPQPVKAWLLAATIKTSRQRIQKGIELLVRKGYAIECGRDEHGVRQLMLARELPTDKTKAA